MKNLLTVLFLALFCSPTAHAFEGRFSLGGEVATGTTSYGMPSGVEDPPDYHQDAMGGFFISGEIKVSEHAHFGVDVDVSWVDSDTSEAGILVLPQFTVAFGTEMGRTSAEPFSAGIGLRFGVGPSFYILSDSEESVAEAVGVDVESYVGLGVSANLLLILHVTESTSALLALGYQGNWNKLVFSVPGVARSEDVDQSIHAMHFRMGLLFGE